MHLGSFLELLQSCPVFGDSSFAIGPSPNQLIDCTYNLLSFHENNIYSWHKTTSELSKINLKRLCSKKELCYQTLLLTAPPLGDVQQLQVSPSGQRLLLSGRSNITVVDLPKRWGHHDAAEEEQQRVTCVSHPIGERFFRFAKEVQISQVKWHPDSLADTHLVALCTDNYIRVYDIGADLQTPSHVVPVGATRSAQLGADTGVSFAGSLGGTAVAFDFGPAVPTSSQQLIQGSDRRDPLPMYLLKGNGDVFALYLDVNVSGVGSHALRGPLSMHPAADDNYGTDACDLICMPSSPPVLVVATPGRLYHAIVLSGPVDSTAADNDEVRSERSCYSAGCTLEPPDISLYVYECAELEMALASPDDNSDLLAPIKLHRDPASDYRYFCTHAFGVHSLSLPLIPALQRYGQLGDESDEPLGEHPAVVAHLVCTRTLLSTPVCPVLGLTVVPHPPVTLVLLSTNQLLALPSTRRFLTESAPDPLADALTAGAEDSISEPGKPADGGSSDSVLAHVRQMLERASSQPLLHSSCSTTTAATAEPPLEERLQLVVRSSRLLRCEYVQRQLAAGLWLRTRAAALHRLRDQQLRDLQQLQLWRRQLTSCAEALAERYHDLLDDQSRINQRVDALFERTEVGTPLLSDAEKKMAKDLKSAKDGMNSLKGKVSDVKSKFEYQKREMATYSSFMVRRDSSASVISNNQLNKIRDVLAKEGDQIAEMVKTIHSAIKTLKL